jgi:hypothetical protein
VLVLSVISTAISRCTLFVLVLSVISAVPNFRSVGRGTLRYVCYSYMHKDISMGLRKPRKRVNFWFGQRYLSEPKSSSQLSYKVLSSLDTDVRYSTYLPILEISERLHQGPEFSHNYLIRITT